jgi:FkbM family methyltransferase
MMNRSPDKYWWQKLAQQRLMQSTGGRLLVLGSSKHGLVDTQDIARAAGAVNTIVDVGANIGQSAVRFRAAFPKARIICLEPVSGTFTELARRTAHLNVDCFNIALGSENTRSTIYLTSHTFSTTNSLVRSTVQEMTGTEEVEVQTLDFFVDQQKIDRIDILKIDVEGFDLEVLQGAVKTLASGRVRFVIVEVGFHPGDDRHPLFDDAREMLMEHGFRVFGLYQQTLEWTGEPSVRFANAVFCRP